MTGILPFIKIKHLRLLFLLSAGLIIIGLPFSVAFMSIGSIGIAAVYLLEGDYKEKLNKLFNNKIALVLLLFFLWHFSSILWSEDKKAALDFSLKLLPFFSFPIVFSGISCLRETDKNILLKLFLASLVAAVLFYVSRNFFWLEAPENDPRKAVIFTSHIRLSLFICLALIALQKIKAPLWLTAGVVVIFLLFIGFIQSLTSLFILGALALVFLLNGFQVQFRSIKLLKRVLGVLAIATLSFLTFTLIDYYSVSDSSSTPEFTDSGTPYNTELENDFIENGSYLWRFVCYKELENSWKSRTGKSIWDEGKSGYPYYSSLVRYLNNLGLTKDLNGVNSLEEKDVNRILSGNSYPDKWKYKGFSQRFRGMLFFLEKSRNGGDFTGNSLSEKIVYQKMGLLLAKDHFWLGTGIGDYKSELSEYFHKEYPEIESRKIRYPHNQFLSVLGRTGIMGVFILCFLLVMAFRKTDPSTYFNLRRAFIVIIFFSLLTEDTLDNQAGITFFALFLGLFFIHEA